MKTILTILLVLICSELFAQFPLKDGAIFYEQIDSLPGVSKDEIYKRSKLWVVNAFKDAKEVVQLDNKEDGEIIGKGTFKFYYTMIGVPIPSWCYFTVKLSSRDGKHRAQIYDLTAVHGERMERLDLYKLIRKPSNLNKKIAKVIDTEIMLTLASLSKSLRDASKDNF